MEDDILITETNFSFEEFINSLKEEQILFHAHFLDWLSFACDIDDKKKYVIRTLRNKLWSIATRKHFVNT